MPKTYRVAKDYPGTISYPGDPVSVRKIQDAGGLSQMTEDDRRKLTFKHVRAGQDCSDMPRLPLEIYVTRGWVVEDKEKP